MDAVDVFTKKSALTEPRLAERTTVRLVVRVSLEMLFEVQLEGEGFAAHLANEVVSLLSVMATDMYRQIGFHDKLPTAKLAHVLIRLTVNIFMDSKVFFIQKLFSAKRTWHRLQSWIVISLLVILEAAQ